MKFYVFILLPDTHTHTLDCYLALELFGDRPGIFQQSCLTLHRGVDEQQAVQEDGGGEDLICSLETHTRTRTHTHTHTHHTHTHSYTHAHLERHIVSQMHTLSSHTYLSERENRCYFWDADKYKTIKHSVTVYLKS